MNDMREAVSKALSEYEREEIKKGNKEFKLTDSDKKLIEYGFVSCALQIAFASEDETFITVKKE